MVFVRGWGSDEKGIKRVVPLWLKRRARVRYAVEKNALDGCGLFQQNTPVEEKGTQLVRGGHAYSMAGFWVTLVGRISGDP